MLNTKSEKEKVLAMWALLTELERCATLFQGVDEGHKKNTIIELEWKYKQMVHDLKITNLNMGNAKETGVPFQPTP